MKSRWLAGLLFLIPLAVIAQSTKLAPELKQMAAGKTISVIVQYKSVPLSAQVKNLRVGNATVSAQLQVISGLRLVVPVAQLASLAADPNVTYVSPDRKVHGHLNNAAPAVLANYAWGLGLSGTGIGVAVIDSGIHEADDLNQTGSGSRIKASFDYTGDGLDDGYGHGTHVAGIIGGNGSDSTCSVCNVTIKGIAPNVNLISLRVLNNQGEGTESQVIQAIQAAIQLKSTYNIRVINLSVGRPVFESFTQDPLCQAVEQAWKAGIVVVVSAGNDGRDNSAGTYGYWTIESPGNDPYVITVGAVNTKATPDRSDDAMTSYSAKGPTAFDYIVKPDLVAPGNRVVSLYAPGQLDIQNPQNRVPLNYYENTGSTDASSNYFVLSGTSMAAGMVSGAAALMIQNDSTLTPDQIKARLMKTAFKQLPR
ncbi:MAG: S8 family peptidase, partial [Candidatus Korobacteraceae bacterium]